MPPATWVPHAEWLPDPDWPEPPSDWTYWSVTAPRRDGGDGRAGGVGGVDRGTNGGGNRLGHLSFPVATVAAQSTVSLAALFPERGRSGGTSYGSSAGAPAAAPVKAGREYYQPRGSGAGALIEQARGPGAPGDGAAPEGSILNGAGTVLTDIDGSEDAAQQTAETTRDETTRAETPGIRLSPILRLVAHPSGLRVQFRVGGPVAAAIADVMTPAIEAATPDLGARTPPPDQSDRAGVGAPSQGSRWRIRPRRGREVTGIQAEGGDGQRHGAGVLSIHDLARRALAARRDGDRDAAIAVERDLCSLHRLGFVAIRPPVVAPFEPVSAAEEAAIRDRVLTATGAGEPGLPRATSAELKAVAADRVAAVVRASNVARRVFAGRREALAEAAWQLVEAHDPAAVVAVVDEALRLSGSDVTCLDAGTDPVTSRAYVTVLVRFPTIGIVAEEQRDGSVGGGRSSWRPRTARERNAVYAAGLASAVLAAAKQAVSIAPATDDVNVVAVRPTRNGRGVEPVYVGRFDREDVSLRHREADPLPLVTSSAVPHGIRTHGPEREVTALDHAADVDRALRELVDACRAADARGRTGPDV
jgi:hypothetical protein